MATITETLEVGPGPFAAPTGPGLTVEGQDKKYAIRLAEYYKNRCFVAYDRLI